MHKHRPVARTFRILTATFGILAFLSAYTIAFAHEQARALQAAGNTNSNIALGR